MRHLFSTRLRVILIIALVLSIGLTIVSGAVNQSVPSLLVQGLLAPVKAGAKALTKQAEQMYNYMFRYEALEERVKQLEAENAQLREEIRAAAALTREVERLTAALDLKTQREDFVLLDVYIIGWDSSDWAESCTINKGSTAGIKVDQCVVTANGEVVGLITEVGTNYAVVKTVLDSSLEISANIAASGYNGMVQGGYATGEEGYLRMNYLPSGAVICNHDQVVTAGSTLYPRDLVLGSVIDAGFDETGVAKFAILEPAADFGSLEQVFVLTSYASE